VIKLKEGEGDLGKNHLCLPRSKKPNGWGKLEQEKVLASGREEVSFNGKFLTIG